MAKSNINLFISYCHDDEPYFKIFGERLKKVAKNAQHFEWNIWDDRNIYVGTFWDDEIQTKLQNCNVAMLLVSVGFMASHYIKEKEFNEFIKKYKEKGILIIPVVLAPCDFNRWEDLGKLQFFKPHGSSYGKTEINDFTYADLIKYDERNNIIPNPNIDRYHLDLLKKVEDSFAEFLSRVEKLNLSNTKGQEDLNSNKLSDAPKTRAYFTGRKIEIEEFKKAIDSKNSFIAIDGPGGIGKTQFVSRCIEKYIPEEKIIWYECTAASQFDTLVSEAGYPELLKGSIKTDREKFSAFKDKIQDNDYFLFLDNFQETNNNPVFKDFLVFIQEYLKKGFVIVIDRDDIRSAVLTPKRIHLEGLKEERLAYARSLINHTYNNDVTINDDNLNALCEQLQGYPLAIDFAIYLLSQGVTPSDIVTKIVQEEDAEQISGRLLNAIFSRPDATQEEKDFIRQFSVFTGSVPEQIVKAIIPDSLLNTAPRKLLKKNLLTYSNSNYEIHPLVREFCYKELIDKENVHAKVAEFYITQRNTQLSPALEEKIFFHLTQSKQWERIEKEIEENGRQFILLGQLGLVKELLYKLKSIGIEKPVFQIFFGDIAQMQGEWDKAKNFFNYARLNEKDKKIKAEGIIKYGEMLQRKGKTNEALTLYEEANNLSKSEGFLKEQARALNDIGLIFKIFGELESAVEKFNNALKIRQDINDKQGMAISLSNLGAIYQSRGEIKEALKKYKESLKIREEIGDKLGISFSLITIGKIYRERGDINKASKFFDESFKIKAEIGDKEGIASYYSNIAAIDRKKGEFDEAIEKHDKSLLINKEIGNIVGISTSLNNKALVYEVKGEIDKALEMYFESLKINEENGDAESYVIIWCNIGVAYTRRGTYDLALIYLFKSLSLLNKIGLKLNQSINCIIRIRDEKIGLENFKRLANEAYNELSLEMQKYIPLNELLRQPIQLQPKVGRNDLCPCGSGKKNKNCHKIY